MIDTKSAQTILAQLHYYRGPVDGNFGPALRAAILAYQAASSLPPTGWLDPVTSHELRASAEALAAAGIANPESGCFGTWTFLDFLKELGRVVRGSFGKGKAEAPFVPLPAGPPPAALHPAAIHPAAASGYYQDATGAWHPVAWATGTAWPWLAAHPLAALGGAAALGYGGYRAWRARHPGELPPAGPGAPAPAPLPAPTGSPPPDGATPHPAEDAQGAMLLGQLTVQDPGAWALVRGWRARMAYDPYAAAWIRRLRGVRGWHTRYATRDPRLQHLDPWRPTVHRPGFERTPFFHPGRGPAPRPAPFHPVREPLHR